MHLLKKTSEYQLDSRTTPGIKKKHFAKFYYPRKT